MSARSLDYVSAVPLAEELSSPSEETARLFDQLYGRVSRYLRSMGLDAADGDEVAQEVFLALFEHLRRGRPRTNLRAWVFRVAHNQGLKRRFRSRRLALVASPEATEEAASAALDPEERMAAEQRHRRFWSVVRALPERDQACLHLRAEGLSYREICVALEISLGAVTISLRRSLDRWRRAEAGV